MGSSQPLHFSKLVKENASIESAAVKPKGVGEGR